MYSKVRATSIEKNDFSVNYIPAGIIEDVVLKGARFEKSPNGNPFLEITFEKEGAILTHTEWKPVIGQYVDTEEKLQAKADNQYSRMLQILTCFYKDEEIDFNGETFEEFAYYVSDTLNKANKEIKLRVKVVYNNKGYTTLPSYAKYTFIEPMVLPEGEKSKIAELSIDQFTKPVVADNEQTVKNPFAGQPVSSTATLGGSENSMSMTTTENASGNDLPF